MIKNQSPVFLSILIVSAIIGIYSGTFSYSWHLDDYRITDNQNLHLKSFSSNSLIKTFYSDDTAPNRFYRPIANLTFALNYYFGELDVRGYHLTNIAIHCISAVFLFLFIRLIFSAIINIPHFKSSSMEIAFFATLLWAVHPIQTQGVTYIIQRMASMAGMFYIASMYWYLKARLAVGSKLKIIYSTLFVVCAFSAFGTKENTFMLPFVVLLFEMLMFRSFEIKRIFQTNWRIISFLFIVGLLAFVYYALSSDNIFFKGYAGRPFTLVERLLTESRVLFFYLSLIFFIDPSKFSIDHDFFISQSIISPITTLVSLISIFLMVLLCINYAKRYQFFVFCVFFFFINQIIESTVVPLEITFEHRNYIPTMLIFVPGISFIFWLRSRCELNNRQALKVIITSGIIVLIFWASYSSYLSNRKWKNEFTLWSDAVQKNPQMIRPRINLAEWYINQNQLEEAQRQLSIAAKLNPYHEKYEKCLVYNNLGVVYQMAGDDNKAEQSYLDSLKINKENLTALSGLISIYSKQGKIELANSYFAKLEKNTIFDKSISYNLGLYELRKGNPAKAIFYFQNLENSRFEVQAFQYIGIAFMQEKLYNQALISFEKVLKQNTRNLRISLHIADAHVKLGHYDQAQNVIDSSVSLLPSEHDFEQIIDWLKNDSDPRLKPDAAVIIPLLYSAKNKPGMWR